VAVRPARPCWSPSTRSEAWIELRRQTRADFTAELFYVGLTEARRGASRRRRHRARIGGGEGPFSTAPAHDRHRQAGVTLLDGAQKAAPDTAIRLCKGRGSGHCREMVTHGQVTMRRNLLAQKLPRWPRR